MRNRRTIDAHEVVSALDAWIEARFGILPRELHPDSYQGSEASDRREELVAAIVKATGNPEPE